MKIETKKRHAKVHKNCLNSFVDLKADGHSHSELLEKEGKDHSNTMKNLTI